MVSIGTIGLIKAVNTFDSSKGIRLSSYAARCIENEVLMFFRNGKKSAQDVSMNEPIDTDKEGNTLTLMDVMSTEDNIVDNLDIKIKSEQLKKYLVEVLTPRERIIIELRYGLNAVSYTHLRTSFAIPSLWLRRAAAGSSRIWHCAFLRSCARAVRESFQ